MMLGYLSKFVLQMLPTIAATVIGAYIVTTWINPKTQPDPAKIAAQQAAKAVPAAEELAVPDVPVATKSAEAAETTRPVENTKAVESARPVETAKPVKAASGSDNIRIIPIVKQSADLPAGTPASVSAAESVTATDERKDANELARAAIQRLRGGSETARATDEPAKPAVSTIRVQQARVVPEPLQVPVATVAPPLPPAVSIASPRYSQIDTADQAAPGQPERPTPPGEIPTARPPISLQASHRVGENPSFAEDFVSATKSFFRAITPQ